MSNAIAEAEPLDAIIVRCKCPSGEQHMADMIIMKTAHEGHFERIDVHCNVCLKVFNTTLMFMEEWEQWEKS